MNGAPALLEVRDLFVEFRTRDGIARVLNGVSYHVDAGETLAVLGESGSGKSVTAQAIMGILEMPPARIRGGSILYRGEDLLGVDADRRREIRGAEIAMVFQDSLSALNPVFPVGWQIAESIRIRRGLTREACWRRAVELMDHVRIPAPSSRSHDYPHQLSGGMRQRVMIAMALALEPKVLIADEPTTALDVTVQAQIMELLADLQRELGMAMILITHDLGVVASVADRVAVMYAGRIVEHADVYRLFESPKHPYTRALIDSIPHASRSGQQLVAIQGVPPNLTRIPAGCPFHPRCRFREAICEQELPPLREIAPGHESACHFSGAVDGRR